MADEGPDTRPSEPEDLDAGVELRLLARLQAARAGPATEVSQSPLTVL